jgi:hypothetical protein
VNARPQNTPDVDFLAAIGGEDIVINAEQQRAAERATRAKRLARGTSSRIGTSGPRSAMPPAAPESDPVQAAARKSRVLTRRYSEFAEEQLIPVYPGMLWQGKYTVLGGDPGLGKSLVASDITARITRGGQVSPYSDQHFEPRTVVLCSSEDGAADTIKPRLRVAGADMARVVDLMGILAKDGTHEHLNLGAHLKALDELLGDSKAALLVLDPVSSFLGKIDSNSGSEVRGVVDPIKRLLEKHKCALLGVLHLNKSERSSAIYRIGGSISMVGAPRMAFGFVRDHSQDSKSDRLLLPIKANLQREEPGYSLRLVDADGFPKLEWRTARPDIAINDALSSSGPSQSQRAEEVLRSILVPGHEVAASVIERACRERGIGKDTRLAALRSMRATPQKYNKDDKRGWFWKISDVQEVDGAEFDAPDGEAIAETIRAPLTEASARVTKEHNRDR